MSASNDDSTRAVDDLKTCIAELDKLIAEEYDKERLKELEKLKAELLEIVNTNTQNK